MMLYNFINKNGGDGGDGDDGLGKKTHDISTNVIYQEILISLKQKLYKSVWNIVPRGPERVHATPRDVVSISYTGNNT